MAERRVQWLLVVNLAADFVGTVAACARAIHAPPGLLRRPAAVVPKCKMK